MAASDEAIAIKANVEVVQNALGGKASTADLQAVDIRLSSAIATKASSADLQARHPLITAAAP